MEKEESVEECRRHHRPEQDSELGYAVIVMNRRPFFRPGGNESRVWFSVGEFPPILSVKQIGNVEWLEVPYRATERE